jgi:cell division protein FtsB
MPPDSSPLSFSSIRRFKLKRLAIVIIFALLILLTSLPAWCGDDTKNVQTQTTKSQADVDRDIAKMSKEMTPMFGNMVESMMQGKLRVFAQQDTTVLLAKFVKNFYNALVAEGFSKEEALQIVTGFGFPAIQ